MRPPEPEGGGFESRQAHHEGTVVWTVFSFGHIFSCSSASICAKISETIPMDETPKTIDAAYATFLEKMRVLKERQMSAIRAFSDRVAQKKIKAIHDRIRKYGKRGKE